jgi:hypothetical protein
MLDWLASWVGLAYPRGLDEAAKRRLLRRAPALYAERGTVEGLRRLLMLHLGLDRVVRPASGPPRRCAHGPACPPPPREPGEPKLVLEHWRLRRWLFLDRGRLGETSRLWGEGVLDRSRLGGGMRLGVTRAKRERDPTLDPFHAEAHAFSVFLPAGRAPTPAHRRRIEALLAREAPAHARAVVHWVEPNMRLGLQCTLGFDTVIGAPKRPPVTLDRTRLGRASVLQDPAGPPAGVRLGRGSPLGVATRLDWRGS